MSKIIKRRIIPKISGTPNTKLLFAFNSLELIFNNVCEKRIF